ncbi:MAG: phosphotransferase [Myxococcota bacterium]
MTSDHPGTLTTLLASSPPRRQPELHMRSDSGQSDVASVPTNHMMAGVDHPILTALQELTCSVPRALRPGREELAFEINTVALVASWRSDEEPYFAQTRYFNLSHVADQLAPTEISLVRRFVTQLQTIEQEVALSRSEFSSWFSNANAGVGVSKELDPVPEYDSEGEFSSSDLQDWAKSVLGESQVSISHRSSGSIIVTSQQEVVKLYRERWFAAKVASLSRELRNQGVPVPQVLGSGLLHRELSYVRFERLTPASRALLTLSVAQGYPAALARALGALHAGRYEGFGDPTWFETGSSSARWEGARSWAIRLLENYIDDRFSTVEKRNRAVRLRRRVTDEDALFACQTPPSLIHADLTLENIPLCDGSIYFLDLDRSVLGDPHFDIAQVFCRLPLLRSVISVDGFMAFYRSVYPLEFSRARFGFYREYFGLAEMHPLVHMLRGLTHAFVVRGAAT